MNTASPTYASVPISRPRTISTTTVFFTLAGLMLLCTALSVLFFLPQSLRLDEAQSLWESSRSPMVVLTLVAEDVHVPLYHELLHFWRLYLGNSVESARLLSLLFYLLSIPAIYALGSLAYSRRAGLIAAVFTAASPFMNWYGNEIRMYTLLLLLTILNQYFFIRLFKKPGYDTWIGYGATALLGAFSHYFFLLNLGAQAIFYFLYPSAFPRGSFRRFAVAAALVIAAVAPWVWYVFHLNEAANQAPLLAIPTTVDVFNTFSQFMLGFQSDNVNAIFLSLWPVGILVAFLALRRVRIPAFETRYFLLTVLVSFAIAFGFSIFVQPVFVSRYLIFTVPSLYLLLAEFLDLYAWRSAIWGTVALMFVMLFVEVASPTTPVKEDYRAATAYLNEHAAPQDVVAISVPFTLYPVEYYYTGDAPLATLPAWNQYSHGAIPAYSPSALPAEVANLASAHQNIWLMQSYDQGYNQEVKEYFDHHFRRLFAETFSPGLSLYEYQIRYDTPISSEATATPAK